MKLLFFNFDTEKVVSWSALVVAICSMAATYMELSLTRKHQRLSVKPIIEFYRNTSHTEKGFTIQFAIANTGLGPARIGHFQIAIDTEPVRTYQDITQRIINEYSLEAKKISPSITTSDIWEGRIIKPEQEVFFISFQDSEFSEYAAKYFKDHTLKVKLCYCSLYEECELYDTIAAKRKPVGQCQWDSKTAFIRYKEREDKIEETK